MQERNISIQQIEGRGIPVRGNDIDTDQIIPARFMKRVTFDGLGEFAFYDHRYDEDGNATKKHPLNDPRFRDGAILLVNSNFGCGSSREHAPQALARFGIRAVIGESFAEIFAGNCTAMGIPAIALPHHDIEQIMQTVETNPATPIQIYVRDEVVSVGEHRYHFDLSPAYRNALLSGAWDSTSVMLNNLEEIKATATRLPYTTNFEPAGVQ